METVISQLGENETCIPWYYPPVDLELRLCSPYEAKDFANKLEKTSHAECKVRLLMTYLDNFIFCNQFTEEISCFHTKVRLLS